MNWSKMRTRNAFPWPSSGPKTQPGRPEWLVDNINWTYFTLKLTKSTLKTLNVIISKSCFSKSTDTVSMIAYKPFDRFSLSFFYVLTRKINKKFEHAKFSPFVRPEVFSFCRRVILGPNRPKLIFKSQILLKLKIKRSKFFNSLAMEN